MKGHHVNDCPDLTDAQRKKFWEDRNAANQAKTATPEPKKGVANAAVAKEKVAPPVIASADQMNFEKFQRFMSAAKELGMEFLNVETPVNNGLNLLSDVAPRSVPGTVVNPGKHVTFAEITKGVNKSANKRFAFDWYKLYLDSCDTYHSAFVRTLLHDVRKV